MEEKVVNKGVKGDRVITGVSYKVFKPLIKLHGESYGIVKKGVWYSLIGNAIKSNTVKCGAVKEDTRINLFIPMKSGYGKLEIEKVFRKSIDGNGYKYSQPTSYHAEQFIGKTVIRGNGNNQTSIPNYGYLHDDFVCIDEGLELFRNKENQGARDYITKALDPVGDNEVVKRGVDVLPNEEIKYCPDCSMVFFFQPLTMDKETVTRGLFRRGIIIYPDISEKEREEALRNRLEDKDTEDWDNWLESLKELRNKKVEWEFPKPTRDAIEMLSKKLIEMGNGRGEKSKAYTDIMFFTLQNLLIKMSIIQAAINDRETVTVDDVQNAYNDLEVFWKSQLDFVTRKVKGRLDYEDGLLSNERYRKCIQILEERKCYSLESSDLSIGEYLKLISEALSVKVSSARLTYYGKLKDKGIIGSKQIGKDDSRVWLVNTLTPLSPMRNIPKDQMREYYENHRGISKEDFRKDILKMYPNMEQSVVDEYYDKFVRLGI